MRFRTYTKWTAYVFAAVAGSLIISSVWIVSRSNRVLSWPIRLSTDFGLQQEFRVWRKARYRISIYCSASAEREDLEKLLQGGNLVQVALKEDGTAVSLDFFPRTRLSTRHRFNRRDRQCRAWRRRSGPRYSRFRR